MDTYEKKYNEALERMRHVVIEPEDENMLQAIKETVFPELRESEDEQALRIIKKRMCYDPVPISDEDRRIVENWLEKQKEQTENATKTLAKILKDSAEGFRRILKKKGIDYEVSNEFWENTACVYSKEEDVEFHKWMDDLMRPTSVEETYEYKKGLEAGMKQKEQKKDNPLEDFSKGYNAGYYHGCTDNEQKPVEWKDEYREEDIQTRFAFYTYKDDPSTLYLSNVFVEEASRNHGFGTRILKAAEKAAEAIGATTISLRVKQDSPANAWYRKRGYGYVAFEDGYDWLEKNLEYLKPKKEVEWSEEDEKMRLEAIRVLVSGCERYRKESGCLPSWHKVIDWLKSLRHHWKPSEEQMKVLQCAIAFMEIRRASDYDISPLKSLYEQLKKLM